MSLPWLPVQAGALRAMLRRTTYSSEAPADPVMAWMELLLIAADGELDQWSERQLAQRWGWSRGKLRRVLIKNWTDHKRTTDGPVADQLRTALGQSFPWLGGESGPPTSQERTTGGPSRARSFSQEEEEDQEQSMSSSPAAEPDVREPELPSEPTQEPEAPPAAKAKPSARHVQRAAVARKAYDAWRAWHPRANAAPASGDLALLRARIADGASLEDLVLVARWVHESPRAGFFRGSNPAGRVYTGIGTLFKRERWSDRLEEARRWEAAGAPQAGADSAVPAPAAGSGGGRPGRHVFLDDEEGTVVPFGGGGR